MPAFIMSFFGLLSIGIVISVGALCVCIPDNAGPILHRRNAMLACNASIFLVSLTVGFVVHSPVMLGIVLFIYCFFFSMLGVYGLRAGATGLAALLVMVLNIDQRREGWEVVIHALYILAGGTWYMLLSLALYQVRPYRLAQQALGDCIQTTAEYLKIRAYFYDRHFDNDANFKQVLQQQILVQESQNLVKELLFKTRDIVKETTTTGRVLIMIYLDAADLFERVMTSYQDYTRLHDLFDETHILEQLKVLATALAEELNEIGIAVKGGQQSSENAGLWESINKVIEQYEKLRQTHLKPENIEGFIALRRILDNIQDIADRVQTLHRYTSFDSKLPTRPVYKIDYKQLTTHQDITPVIFLDNINFQSNIFRHSLRVSIAVMAGYLISLFFEIGHSYWILLTIIVILKPAYSLTKKRNADRLIGTVCGVLLGVIILYLVKDHTALLVIMILLMTGTYVFLRKHYLVSVLMMTPYIILFFYLLNPVGFTTVLTDRVFDTAIGSVIAFAASILLVPAWEHTTIKSYLEAMLKSNSEYFKIVSRTFEREQVVEIGRFHISRSNALIDLANLTDAFNRMLSEPRWEQKGVNEVNELVVLNHMLTSHIATLSYYIQSNLATYRSEKFKGLNEDIIELFTEAVDLLNGVVITKKLAGHNESLRQLNDQANQLMEIRKKELQEGKWETATKKTMSELKSVVDQFNFIYKILIDVNKVCRGMNKEV
jgi:uncharacterized membrane protein (TIGR01666 family)